MLYVPSFVLFMLLPISRKTNLLYFAPHIHSVGKCGRVQRTFFSLSCLDALTLFFNLRSASYFRDDLRNCRCRDRILLGQGVLLLTRIHLFQNKTSCRKG